MEAYSRSNRKKILNFVQKLIKTGVEYRLDDNCDEENYFLTIDDPRYYILARVGNNVEGVALTILENCNLTPGKWINIYNN